MIPTNSNDTCPDDDCATNPNCEVIETPVTTPHPETGQPIVVSGCFAVGRVCPHTDTYFFLTVKKVKGTASSRTNNASSGRPPAGHVT